MRTLQLNFTTQNGQKRSLNLKNSNPNLTAAVVQEQMQVIADAKLFMQDGEEIYFEPLAAKYIETTEIPIF